MQLDGCSALVTGGASGLGNATARALVEGGAHVVILDLPSSEGEKAAIALGPTARFVPADVTDEEAVQAAVDTASTLGPLRVVVNCAGIATAEKVIGRDGLIPLDHFERVVRVNLIGTFNVVRLAAAAIAETEPVGEERGVIVNTASVAAFDGQIGQIAYAASKAGVAGMTLPAARDLAAVGVRVVTIAPGTFATPAYRMMPEDRVKALEELNPFPKRMGKPDEYGALVEHICTNTMLNGEVIRIDGAVRFPPK